MAALIELREQEGERSKRALRVANNELETWVLERTAALSAADTENQRALKALRESEEKYRGIFDDSITTICLFDTEKGFIDANQARLDLLGYSLSGVALSEKDLARLSLLTLQPRRHLRLSASDTGEGRDLVSGQSPCLHKTPPLGKASWREPSGRMAGERCCRRVGKRGRVEKAPETLPDQIGILPGT